MDAPTAAGVLGASLQNMAISIATERSDGTLKHLAGTPMPRSAFFVGKVVQVLAVTALIIVVLLLVAVVFYGVDLPSGSDWLTFLCVTVLGSAACTGLMSMKSESRARAAQAPSSATSPKSPTPQECCDRTE